MLIFTEIIYSLRYNTLITKNWGVSLIIKTILSLLVQAIFILVTTSKYI